MKIVPVNGRVLVKPSIASRSRGGIHLPDASQTPSSYGEVLAVSGPWRDEDNGEPREMPAWCNVGDCVHYKSHAGSEAVDDKGERLVLISVDSIIAKRVEK